MEEEEEHRVSVLRLFISRLRGKIPIIGIVLTVRGSGEVTILDQEGADIHRIIDAAIKLMIATEVVDADNKSLSSRHVDRLRRPASSI